MFIPTSRKFYDEFTGSGGGGVSYLNSLQGDKITCVIDGYFFWSLENQKFIFDSATKTITISYSAVSGLGQTKGFINAGFAVDGTFDVVGSPTNDGAYTIAAITDGVITTVEALNSETAPSASIFNTKKITDLDLYYDLIPNLSNKSDFVSATDKETVQKYSATGLDASVATPVPLTISSVSYGWVTDIVTNDDEGEGFVEGVSITDYRQYFKITHVFYMTRIWTKEIINNFLNRTAPEEYIKGNHLKHVCKIDGKFSECDPLIAQTGSIFKQNGDSGWFNQDHCQTKPEYTLSSIQYQDFATSEFISQINSSIVNLVTVVINSRSGKFVAGTTMFILNHFLCPQDESVYINTDTTLLQNIRLDKAIITMDAAAIDGIEVGTDYQSLKNIEATFFDANNVVITFKVDYSAVTKTIFKNRNIADRLYAFIISCQDIALTTSTIIDRVNVIADFNVADYDERDATLWGLIDFIQCFKFPNAGVFENNTVVGYEGDPAYVEIPFWVETLAVNGVVPILKNVSCKIVSTKAGEDDFILEEKIFDTSNARKFDGTQVINIETSREFIFPGDSPFNRADIVRYEDGDSGTKIAYKLRYAFALRFEDWLEVVSGTSFDIFNDIEEVVQAWKRYSTGNGWALKFRMDSQVQGYDGVITDYTTETDINILAPGDAPASGNNFSLTTKYFNEDGDQTGGLVIGEKIRIVAKFVGNPAVFPASMTIFNGFIYVCDEFGTIFTRRIACSDFDSEVDSPFSVEDLPVLQGYTSQMESANLRLTVFSNRIELDTWYTLAENSNEEKMIVAPRLGYAIANVLLKEDGSALLKEDNGYILLENQ